MTKLENDYSLLFEIVPPQIIRALASAKAEILFCRDEGTLVTLNSIIKDLEEYIDGELEKVKK